MQMSELRRIILVEHGFETYSMFGLIEPPYDPRRVL
jgi:hypothetical protein